MPHSSVVYSAKTLVAEEPRELIKQSSYPVPIFSIRFHGRTIADPATADILAKQKHEEEKRLTKVRMKHAQSLPERVSSDDMVKYIELCESDPAPLIGTEYGTEYDWRYSGGNLEALDFDRKFYLAQAATCDDYAIRVLDPSSDFEHIEMNFDRKCFTRNYGYEIMKTRSHLGIRRKKSVNLLLRNDLRGDKCNYEASHIINWSTEIAASALTDSQLLFIDVKNELLSCNLDGLLVNNYRKLPAYDRKELLPVSLNVIDQNVIIYSTMKALHMIDLRVGQVDTIFCSDRFFIKCEELSYHKRSVHDNLLYAASSHMLYGIDLRHPHKTLMHWTHQITMQPSLMKTVKYGSDEVICLSSNKAGDMKIFNCSKGCQDEQESWSINRLPLKPHDIRQSYNTMRDIGRLLLSNSVKHRTSLSTTGIAMITNKKSDRIKLYTQNSFGDVFKSYLQCKGNEPDKDQRLNDNFMKWDEALHIDKNPKKSEVEKENPRENELQFIDIVNLRGLAKVMLCKKFQSPEEDDEASEMQTQRVPRWKADLEEQKMCTDALSQHILDQWDLKLSDYQPEAFAEALKTSDHLRKTKGVDKVSEWLEATGLEGLELAKGEEDPVEAVKSHLEVPPPKPETAKKTKKRVKGF